jgi:hypothetical protein
VEGNQKLSAKASANCFAQAFVKVAAKAVAEALEANKCLNPTAEVFVKTATSANYTEFTTCAESTSSDGAGTNLVTDTTGINAGVVRSNLFAFLCHVFLWRPVPPEIAC